MYMYIIYIYIIIIIIEQGIPKSWKEYLPRAGNNDWRKGTVIVTTMDRNLVPLISITPFAKYNIIICIKI